MIDCREIKSRELELLGEKVKKLDKSPCLVIFRVGNDSASEVYVRNKVNAGKKVGIDVIVNHYDEITTDELIDEIDVCNNDINVNGILVQLPLPKDIDEDKVIEAISPIKDVDGLTKTNQGNLFSGKDTYIPCTAKGVMRIIDELDVDLAGQKVTIVGRSKLVGKPLIELFLKRHAIVRVSHSRSKDLKSDICNADIVVTAVGKKRNLITADMVKEDSIIIDVAIIRDEIGMCGDVDYDGVISKVKYITPVPGGVGQMTVLELFDNVYEAYLRQNS